MTNLTLYAFPTAPGFFNLSPFCAKADILLKLSGLDYRTDMPEDFKALPKGKLPVLKDGDTLIPDSELIRLYLAEKYGKTLDDGMDETRKATGHALCRMLDHRTHLSLMWTRWVDDAGWAQTKPLYFSEAPEGLADMSRGLVRQNLDGTGFSRFSDAERLAFFQADLEAADTLIGDRAFFGGDQPCYVDASLFGHIANYYASPIKSWTTAEVAKRPRLVAYIERGLALWYPDAAAMMAGAAE
ncbi:glutathione S-transferase family protein [Kordiimonas marina]|uniref:glutathione S-transferase family protein n=1 Tax=Kordiimonas marina TaxID=2872312 RepID=UPI001FF2E378|nr:glutathione S-transferase family protein [Kordiimonas marina]MCJ9427654.1 glutathione S-transferase family protein [Kordiimonas marina]